LKKELLYFFLFTLSLLIYSSVTYIGLADAQNSEIIISSDNSFVNEIGNLHVVGEAENNSPNPVQFVRIIGTFYDSEKNVAPQVLHLPIRQIWLLEKRHHLT